MPLAVDSYRDADALADDAGLLSLAWTLDERSQLSVDLDAVISRELEAEVREDLSAINSYLVRDPYGETFLGPAVEAFFRLEERISVTGAAGVNSLLYCLARAGGGDVYILGETYPDLPHWVQRFHRRCVSHDPQLPVGEHLRRAARSEADLIFVERPGLILDPFADLADLEALCREVAGRSAIVMVDESNANYAPPAYSAVNLTGAVENLVVLRGFSKAYALGGLRLAFCVTATALATRVRSAVPPLLASSLSLRIGRRILELGDVAAPLRQGIPEARAELGRSLGAAGFCGLPASRYLPYVLLEDGDSTRSRLRARGIIGKSHLIWSGQTMSTRSLYRLSAPLSAGRMDALHRKLRQPEPD
jgi:histidinol-phosphate/aromatic aminotransferase/cobyric acid decarboxylase-like protein